MHGSHALSSLGYIIVCVFSIGTYRDAIRSCDVRQSRIKTSPALIRLSPSALVSSPTQFQKVTQTEQKRTARTPPFPGYSALASGRLYARPAPAARHPTLRSRVTRPGGTATDLAQRNESRADRDLSCHEGNELAACQVLQPIRDKGVRAMAYLAEYFRAPSNEVGDCQVTFSEGLMVQRSRLLP